MIDDNWELRSWLEIDCTEIVLALRERRNGIVI